MQTRFIFYGRFTDVTGDRLTPKYRLIASYGNYEPMGQLIGNDGFVSITLMPSVTSGHLKPSAPDLRLQAKSSLPFTGLYFLLDGKDKNTCYGWGNPPRGRTYGNKTPRANPFWNCQQDGFLFVFPEPDTPHPTGFELLVIKDAKDMIPDHCKRLKLGFYDSQLTELRKQAVAVKPVV